ncbi:MAG: DUF418 domain-containing protein [Microbacterium sp.]|nr:DUF418 domain-containing protein [Microbacterium sp.]MBN9188537.1 DUF418 domain-containing protein [Microbacterium sp.]
MFAAHLIALAPWDWREPATWGDIASGRSSILFATLAGVSIALVSGGAHRMPRGPRLTFVRQALAIRGILLWLIGLALIATGVPVFVILPAYALLFLLALPLLRLAARTLWIVAAALALVMPWIQPALDALPLWQGEQGAILALLLGWHYPVTVWIVFLVAGLAAGRSGLAVRATQARLLGAGAALAVIGYGADAVVRAGAAGSAPFSSSIAGDPLLGAELTAVLTARAHSGGLFEVVGSGGVALAVIGACGLVCRARAVAAAVLPLRAVGSMPLTAYVAQIVAWAVVAAIVLGDTADLDGMRALHPFWPFVVGTVLLCTAWALLVGRGPLEALLAVVSRRVLGR